MLKNLKIFLLCVLLVPGLCACSDSEEDVSDNFSKNINNISENTDTEEDAAESRTESSDNITVSRKRRTEDDKKVACSECNGTGYISCPPCGATGSVQCQQCEGRGGFCTYCDGSGRLDCATCRGEGYIACELCGGRGSLRASAGQTDSASAGGEETISICPDCKGEGRLGSCKTCGGDGWDENRGQSCVKCLHTGKNRCERCDGYGMLDSNGNGVSTNAPSAQQNPNDYLPDSSYGQSDSKCWSCKGEGVCQNCGGSGRYGFNPEWAGDGCKTCGGTGRCPACDGRGRI